MADSPENLIEPTPQKTAPGRPPWLSYPTLYSTDEEVRGWMDRHMNPQSHRRRYHTQRAALNLWFYLGRQWIEARAELAPGNGVYHFAEIYRNSLAAFPRPVTNIIAPTIDNEVARLGRKEFIPDAEPEKNKPEWMAAARLAKDICRWEMGKNLWEVKRDDLAFNMLIDAVSILRTWWDENDSDLALIASGQSMSCPGCGARFASAEIPRSFSTIAAPVNGQATELKHKELLTDVDMGSGEASALHPKGIPMLGMEYCPLCDDLKKLTFYPLNEKDALETDVFGRQLGMFVPRGETAIEAISLHEYFPENGGLHYEPHEQTINMQMAVRPLEYIALRYPELEDDLHPQEPRELLRLNPIYAEPLLSGYMGYNLSVGSESYSNHAALKEVVIQPQPHIPGLENGAIFARVGGGTKIVRRELLVEVEGEGGVKYVPRTKFHFSRFKRWPKSFWSRTVVDDLIPIQRRLNEIDAQMMDIRERGAPNMWVPNGTTLYTRDDIQGSLKVVHYDSPYPDWQPQSGLFPGVPLTGNTYGPERDRCMQDAKMVGAPQDIEVGEAPGSVKTTSGLMMLDEAAAQKRGPRERGMTRMFESGFEHVVAMNWAFRKDDMPYEIRSDAGVWEQKSFTGTDLLGPMRVKMVARKGYDNALYNKEAAGEVFQMGILQMTSPDQVDRLLELMNMPKDLNERDHLQVTRAEEAWSDFVHLGKVHVPDIKIEHPIVWYAVLAKRWFSDEAVILQRETGWEELIPPLTGWEEFKGQLETLELQQKPIYAGKDPSTWGSIYAQGKPLVEQAVKDYQTAMGSFQDATRNAPPEAQPGDLPQPPQPPMMMEFPKPPEGGFLPPAEHEKIYEVWLRMLPQLRLAVNVANQAQSRMGRESPKVKRTLQLDQLLRIRAVIESYRLAVTQQAMPGPGAAPPGPGGPAPVAPGPGAPMAPPPPGGGA